MRIISNNLIFEAYLKVYKFFLVHYEEKFDREYLKTADSVAALVYDTEKQKYIFVRQFRVGVAGSNINRLSFPHQVPGKGFPETPNDNCKLTEIVAGHIDEVHGKMEDPEVAITREIKQEIGYAVDKLELLVPKFYTSPGFSTETITIYYAEVSHKIGKGGGAKGENEHIEIVEMPEDGAMSYNFMDGKTIMALDRICMRNIDPWAGVKAIKGF